MKTDAIFKKYLTAEHAEIAEIIFIFFLSVLCELRGELLVFFSIRQTGRFSGQRRICDIL
jgi:hypothetical protein